MTIFCPKCGTPVRLGVRGTIGKHDDVNRSAHQGRYPVCEYVGRRVLMGINAFSEYLNYWQSKKETDPWFTFSGWIRHNQIEVTDTYGRLPYKKPS